MKIVELSPEQLEPLTRFVADLPDRDRTFLDDDVSDPHGVAALPARPGKRWVVVEDTEGAEITGFASVRPHSGWSNHVATLHLIVHPDHRHGGVGTELARYALASSLSEGLRKVQVEIAAEDESAINMFSQLGFTGEALLRDHIRGRDGQYRDLVVLAHLVDDIQRPDAEPAVGGARRGAFVSSEWTRVGVVRESNEGERRVALVPTAVAALVGKSVDVVVEADAGGGASIPDEAYVAAGASIGDAWSADVVVKVAPPSAVEVARLSEGQTLIGFLAPRDADNQIGALKDAGVQAFALEAIPRISRAQVMDALSSQANVAGYKAVVLAAWESTRFFPMLTTAAGTVKPAMVLVLGVGVAGLQALATAKRLGGRPTGYDVRPEVADQVRSVGAQWLDLGIEAAGEGGYARELTDEEKAQQQQKLEDAIKGFDVVITTALVPGRPAPRLVTAAAVQGMRPGSVIVDLAGETGGNCELTEPGETVVKHAVTICSPLNLPATMPEHASELYSKNISALLELMLKDRKLDPDFTDQVLADSRVTREKD